MPPPGTKLPKSMKAATVALAELDSISLNQFIAAAVAEKVGTLRTAREFLQERASGAKLRDIWPVGMLTLFLLKRKPRPDYDKIRATYNADGKP